MNPAVTTIPIASFDVSRYAITSLEMDHVGVSIESSVHEMPVHSDVVGEFLDRFPLSRIIKTSAFTPLSSMRTVRSTSPGLFDATHLKLSYPRTLGRYDRHLTRRKALAGPETYAHLAAHAPGFLGGKSLALLPEYRALHCARSPGDESGWGAVWRHERPTPTLHPDVTLMIPLFSLWSGDQLSSNGRLPLLCLLWPDEPELRREWLETNLLVPLIEVYLVLLDSCGVSAELNSQNVLLGITDAGLLTAIILRDMMGLEKDVSSPQWTTHRWSSEWQSFPYKFLDASIDRERWQARHSLAFDHRLQTYILDPLISLLQPGDQTKCRENLRSYVEARSTDVIPNDWFPRGPMGVRLDSDPSSSRPASFVDDVPIWLRVHR